MILILVLTQVPKVIQGVVRTESETKATESVARAKATDTRTTNSVAKASQATESVARAKATDTRKISRTIYS